PGLRAVHRLDRDTSGCLWFSRSETARAEAIELFRANRVLKVYEAIVLGRFPQSECRMEEPIDGQPACTTVRRLRASDQASHVRLTIETGRTHQIRKHLLGAGFPIAGDKAYGTARSIGSEARSVPRQMLHALELEARFESGERLCARAPLPPDFRATLRRFKLE
ncbi:MAG: RluA family pseudouridine synthase, partial [Kiritimatiellia bacterium]|nr:RluA family pseudouridine synthase [Kiritimatiellia bacterium]